jgi:pimeloyl-ACP methyl ester carboxylesterase
MRPGALLDAIFEALDRTIDEPVVLVGNSMGGYAAVRYARSRPERVRALVLCSPAGALVGDAEDALEEIRRVFRIRDHAAALEFLDRLLAKPPPLRHLFALALRRRFGQRDLRDLIERISAEDALAPDEVAGLAVPALLLWGDRDRILPESQLEFWRAHLPPDTPIERPRGMGHSPYLDRPGALSRRILEFARSAASNPRAHMQE